MRFLIRFRAPFFLSAASALNLVCSSGVRSALRCLDRPKLSILILITGETTVEAAGGGGGGGGSVARA